MPEIKDFKCTYDNAVGIRSEIIDKLHLTFPDAYLHWETMTAIAEEIKAFEGASFCELPFCHTVEAEAMGGMVNYGNAQAGPRAKEYICTKLEQILELPDIDFSQGRIHEVLLACKALREKGEHVVLEVAGPLTVLNVLIDANPVFKAMRKQPELIKQVFWKIGKNLLAYVAEAQRYGVDMISYADSSGGVNILGPKMAAQVVEDFTYTFLHQMAELVTDEAIILLCPKTTFALLGTERAEFVDVELPGPMRYGEACAWLIGKEKFAGQMCIKNISYSLNSGKCKAVRLK